LEIKKKSVLVAGPSFPNTNKSINFIDKTHDYGLGEIEAVRMNAVDFNNDGYTDLVVLPSNFSKPRWYQFDIKKKKFKELNYSPLPKSLKASYLLFYDLNHDDILDLIVGVLNQETELTQYSLRFFDGSLLKNRIWFTQRKSIFPSEPLPSASASLIDINLDGELDIFLANWIKIKNKKPVPVHDRLYVREGKVFTDQTALLKGELKQNSTKESYVNAMPSFSSSTCDIDRNGFPDILTTSTNGFRNKLWVNTYQFSGNKRYFTDYAKKSGMSMDNDGLHISRGGGRTFFSSCADYNNDSLMDIYLGELTHSYDNDNVDRSSILTNITKDFPPKFIRTEYLGDSNTFNWSRGDKRAIWFDYNFDGLLDLLVDNTGFPPYSRLVLFEQEETNDFYDEAESRGVNILNSQGSIILDINRDGKLDILSSQSNIREPRLKQRLYLFENHMPWEGRRSLRVFPRGIKANSSALGAMINLETKLGKKTINKRHWIEYSQGGLPSQNEEGVLFGLKSTEKLIKVSVRWPILKGPKSSSRSALVKTYRLEGIKISKKTNTMNITLCEDGRLYFKKRFCR
jgi:hypothetical protein